MKKFTVLLLYPDYMTDGQSQVYHGHVRAKNPYYAVIACKKQAKRTNGGEPENADDFLCVGVFEGHIRDLNPGDL